MTHSWSQPSILQRKLDDTMNTTKEESDAEKMDVTGEYRWAFPLLIPGLK